MSIDRRTLATDVSPNRNGAMVRTLELHAFQEDVISENGRHEQDIQDLVSAISELQKEMGMLRGAVEWMGDNPGLTFNDYTRFVAVTKKLAASRNDRGVPF